MPQHVREREAGHEGHAVMSLAPCTLFLGVAKCLLLLLVLWMSSCGYEEPEPTPPPTADDIGIHVSEVTCYSACLSGDFAGRDDSTLQVGIRFGLRYTKSLATIGKLALAKRQSDGTLSIALDQLFADTTYYYMTVTMHGGTQTVTSDVYSFRTHILLPTTVEATDVFAFGAQLGIELSEPAPPGKFLGTYGVYVTDKSRISDVDPTLMKADSLYRIRNLRPGKKYRYAAYVRQRKADNKDRLLLGALKEMVMPQIAVTTDTALPVTSYSANLRGNANAEFSTHVAEAGFLLFRKQHEATLEEAEQDATILKLSPATYSKQGWGAFSLNYTKLEALKVYYYRAYALIRGSDNMAPEQAKPYYGRVVKIYTTRLAATEGDYVDLGLSVKWSSKNVGAAKNSDTGKNYQFANRSEVNTGVGRLPTLEEAKELVDSCHWVWKNSGTLVGAFVTGPNGNSIFLPANKYTGTTATYGYYMLETDSSIVSPKTIKIPAITFGAPDLQEQQATQKIDQTPIENEMCIRCVE